VSAKETAHPYIWLTANEAAEIRQRLATDPQAQTQYERTKRRAGPLADLFEYLVRQDQAAGERERKLLLTFIGSDPDKASAKLTHGGRHLTGYLDVLRYDALYGALTPEERAGVEKTFRAYIEHHLKDQKEYTRTSWLPNMQWPRPMAAHLMALALGDAALIRQVFESNGGWKYYFDDYVADGRFYMEEFGKQYSMIGEMFLWCRGLDRLGLPQSGYDYTGKDGATMRRYLEGLLDLTYPRVELPGGMPHYPRITQGDKRGTAPFPFDNPAKAAFQHATVSGRLASKGGAANAAVGSADGGEGANADWTTARMNGQDHRGQRVPKMGPPLWFELAHQKWPDAGFDYFLAQMRERDEPYYWPTLLFGLKPVDPAKVKPPAAPSWVSGTRGVAMLRWDESPAYWESPAPAVALSMSRYYVHSKPDSFSILGYYAFNRPIYIGRAFGGGAYDSGPYFTSARSHLSVVVDNLPGQFADAKNNGSPDAFHYRQHLMGPGRFLAVRSSGVFPDVDQERACVLTDAYLFDAFQLTSNRPRTYQWQIQALGVARPDRPGDWKPSEGLHHTRLFDMNDEANRVDEKLRSGIYDPKDARERAAGKDAWSLLIRQEYVGPDVARSALTPAWYDRQVGVRLWMLGAPEPTTVYYGKTPNALWQDKAYKGEPVAFFEPEVGGVTVMAERVAAKTTFVALHAPFEKGTEPVTGWEPMAAPLPDVTAVRVRRRDGATDVILLRWGDKAAEPATVTDGANQYTFAGYGLVRQRADVCEIGGTVTALSLRAAQQPALRVNGRAATGKAEYRDGTLHYTGEKQ
jgi:hypothetical protein